MKLLLVAAVVVTATLTLTGCPNRDPQPVPAPRSSASVHRPQERPVTRSDGTSAAPAAQISYFQGTLEEAFSRRPRTDDAPQFR
jgi:hypothetical protein